MSEYKLTPYVQNGLIQLNWAQNGLIGLLIGSRGYGQKRARANVSRLGKLQYQNFQNEAANNQLTEFYSAMPNFDTVLLNKQN